MKKILNVFFLTLIFSGAAYASSAYDVLDEIPVQHNGRVKPFASFARETSLNVLGGAKAENKKPSALVWQWIANPELWFSKPFIPVSFKPLQKELGLSVVRGRISPQVILGNQDFLKQIEEIAAKQAAKENLKLIEKKKLELYGAALLFQQVANGENPGWLAHPEEPRASWMPMQGFGSREGLKTLAQFYPEELLLQLYENFKNLITALSKSETGETPEAVSAAEKARKTLADLLNSKSIALDQPVLKAEITYDRLHPFSLAGKIYLLSVFLFVLIAWRSAKNKVFWSAAVITYAAAFLIHAYGFYLRCTIAGRPPVSNMYESIIWVSWGVAFFSLILFSFYRSALIPLAAGLVAALALLVAESFPAVLDPSITPLVPVLRSNLWLTIHVLTITLSYGAFALAWGIGHFTVFGFLFSPEKTERNNTLSLYLYRAVQIGVVLLAAGTVLGGVWANYSWGRFWGWDPKETWALIALLGYLAVLHGRFAGWLGTFGTVVGCIIAFLGVVMAWYGVNYVLAAGLHSYGFGGGGAPYVMAICLLDMAVIIGAAFLYKAKTRTTVSKP